MYQYVRPRLYYNTKTGELCNLSVKKCERMALHGAVFSDKPFSFGTGSEAKLRLFYNADACVKDGVLYRLNFASDKPTRIVLSEFCHTVRDYSIIVKKCCHLILVFDDKIKRVDKYALHLAQFSSVCLDISGVTKERLRKRLLRISEDYRLVI